uniref:Uncharacterized protein n=1 Tax=Oryza meridionalis TaxID=40149 RepID=A0A0E0DZM0_9ORYZ
MREAVTNLASRAGGGEHGIRDATCPIEVPPVDEVSARELCGGWPAGGEEACEARRFVGEVLEAIAAHYRHTLAPARDRTLVRTAFQDPTNARKPCSCSPAGRRPLKIWRPRLGGGGVGEALPLRRLQEDEAPSSSMAARGETMEAGGMGGQAWEGKRGWTRRRRMAPTGRGKSPPSSSMAARGKATEASGLGGRARENEADADGADGEREDVAADLAPVPSAAAVTAAWGEALLLPHRHGRHRSPASRHPPLLPGVLAPPAGLLRLRRKSERERRKGEKRGKRK